MDIIDTIKKAASNILKWAVDKDEPIELGHTPKEIIEEKKKKKEQKQGEDNPTVVVTGSYFQELADEFNQIQKDYEKESPNYKQLKDKLSKLYVKLDTLETGLNKDIEGFDTAHEKAPESVLNELHKVESLMDAVDEQADIIEHEEKSASDESLQETYYKDERYTIRVDYSPGKETHKYEVYLIDEETGKSSSVSSWKTKELAEKAAEKLLNEIKTKASSKKVSNIDYNVIKERLNKNYGITGDEAEKLMDGLGEGTIEAQETTDSAWSLLVDMLKEEKSATTKKSACNEGDRVRILKGHPSDVGEEGIVVNAFPGRLLVEMETGKDKGDAIDVRREDVEKISSKKTAQEDKDVNEAALQYAIELLKGGKPIEEAIEVTTTQFFKEESKEDPRWLKFCASLKRAQPFKYVVASKDDLIPEGVAVIEGYGKDGKYEMGVYSDSLLKNGIDIMKKDDVKVTKICSHSEEPEWLGKHLEAKGHYCDNCDRHLAEEDYDEHGGWSYTCPYCGFRYLHDKPLDEQLEDFKTEASKKTSAGPIDKSVIDYNGEKYSIVQSINYEIHPRPKSIDEQKEIIKEFQQQMISEKRYGTKKLAYVQHCPGHKNSEGESAEWCIKKHDGGDIISSHKTKEEAEEHLRDINTHK